MRDIWSDYEKWTMAGKTCTLATVVSVSGSSLRPTGSKMLFSSSGELSGSVSGGCIEGAVFEEASQVAKNGKPVLVSYGVSDESAWQVGLSCGGSVKILIESMSVMPWSEITKILSRIIQTKKVAAIATIVSSAELGKKLILTPEGIEFCDISDSKWVDAIRTGIPSDWVVNDPISLSIPFEEGEISVFIEFLLPPPRLIIVGAVHIAIPLVTLAKALNYQTIVVDPRSAFLTKERFPHADLLVGDWPDEALSDLKLDPSTSVVCLSHDEKIDIPALKIALDSSARYVGALGSRKTNEKRLELLAAEGVNPELVKKMRSPVGLKLGGKEPAEIALSIIAEIIATQHGQA